MTGAMCIITKIMIKDDFSGRLLLDQCNGFFRPVNSAPSIRSLSFFPNIDFE